MTERGASWRPARNMTRRGWLAGSAAMGAALVAACGGPTGADTAQESGGPIKLGPGEGGAPQPAFQTGQVAMQTMAVGLIGPVAQAAQFPWDVTFIPKGKTGQRANYAGTLLYGVSTASKQPDAAWSLLKTICGTYGVGLHVQAQIGAPSLKGLEKEYLALPPPPANRKVVLDSLVLLRALPKVRGMNDIYEPAFTQTLNRAYAGEITATEAARLIDEKATPLIKKG